MTKKLLVFGTGLMAEVVAWQQRHDWNRAVDAFTVDAAYCDAPTFAGAPVIPYEFITKHCPPHEYEALVAVGYAQGNRVRAQKSTELTAMGYTLTNHVSPLACVPKSLSVPPGCFLFEKTVLQPFVQLGRNTVIWPGAFIGHHTRMGDHCFFGPNATVCGGVKLGEGALVGAGAVIRDFVRVGDHCTVGAGSVLLRDLPDGFLCHVGESAVYPHKEHMTLWPPKTQRPGSAL